MQSIPEGLRATTHLLFFLLLSLATTPALAETDGTLTGTVTMTDGDSAIGTRVLIVELHRSVFVDQTGGFRFDGVPPGNYHVQASRPGVGSAVHEIRIDGNEAHIDIRLERSEHQERIVVTATRGGRGSAEVVQPVKVVDREQISKQLQPTLGETLAEEPGVSSTYFGPGASRPIIRGQTETRVRVLEDGVGVGDASAVSPDHAVAVDPMGASQIEVLRGPATLLYGSTAVGGVVNVIDASIPDHVPQRPFGGTLDLRLGSVSNERTGALSLDGGEGPVAWHLGGLRRRTDDLDIPGRAQLPGTGEPGEIGDVGTLSNSDVGTDRFDVGASYHFDEKGYVGLSLTGFDSTYGIPGEGHAHDDGGMGGEEQEAPIRIDMEQRRLDLKGHFHTRWGTFRQVNFRVGVTDYQHVELEGVETGTVYENDSSEGRLEFHHGRSGPLRGVLGTQIARRDFEATGEEAFAPPSETDLISLFALEEVTTGPVRFEIGLRYENQAVAAPGVCENGATCSSDAACTGIGGGTCRLNPDRDFDGVSGSLGLLYSPGDTYALGLSLTRAERIPTAEELYSFGPHLATLSFEIGNPALEKETSLGVDLSLRKRKGNVTGELNLFANRFDDYIFPRQQFDMNGDPLLMDDLPVFRTVQTDTRFYGGELQVVVGIVHSGEHDVDLKARTDYVRAEERGTGIPLPLIPPLRNSVGIDYVGPRWAASAEVLGIYRQDRVPPGDTETPGYTMVNASVSRRFFASRTVHELSLRGRNLTDRDARNSASRLRNSVPLPARDITFVYRLTF